MAYRGLTTDHDQPLIAIPLDEGGREVVRHFRDDEAADAATAPQGIEADLGLAVTGATSIGTK